MFSTSSCLAAGESALALVLVFVIGCPAPLMKSREMAGTFSEQDTPLIVFARWRSSDPDAPFFNDPTATDWEIVLQARDETLAGSVDLAVLGSPEAEGATLAYQPLSWHEQTQRVVGLMHGVPRLIVLDEEDADPLRSLEPEFSALAEAFGEVDAAAATALDASLSPDGEIAASFYLHAFEGSSVFDLRFVFAVFFSDALTGADLGHSDLLPLDDRVDPRLTPRAPVPLSYRMLWASDSSGVFVLNADEAVFVTVDDPQSPAPVTEVPAEAVPTSSGPVASDGRLLRSPSADVAEGTVTLGEVTAWVPFFQLEQISLAAIDYAIPLPED